MSDCAAETLRAKENEAMTTRLTRVQRKALADVAAGLPYDGGRTAGDFSRRHRVLLRLIARGLITSKDSVSLQLTRSGNAALSAVAK